MAYEDMTLPSLPAPTLIASPDVRMTVGYCRASTIP